MFPESYVRGFRGYVAKRATELSYAIDFFLENFNNFGIIQYCSLLVTSKKGLDLQTIYM